MTRWILLGALVAACAGYLVYSATGTGVAYYRTVAEVKAAPGGSDVRVLGTVRDVTYGPTPLDVRFDAVDAGYTMAVTYHGQLPDIFRNGVQVVVEGSMGRDGTFHAATLLTKCPSRFTAGKSTG
ncbi:MAG TPA: cytochrome c maturation protein CcmE [Candidatus Dormibacteraeota bacterium]